MAASSLAKEINKLDLDAEKKLESAYQKVMCRSPSPVKLALLKELYRYIKQK